MRLSINTKSIILFFISLVSLFCSCANISSKNNTEIPLFMIGEFEDDYSINYKMDNQVFALLPNDRFYIKRINREDRFIILQNDSMNQFAPSLYSRIDYEKLENMEPFEWAFCFSSYEETNIEDAIKNAKVDKTNLKEGCNGFPFSRMKPSSSEY